MKTLTCCVEMVDKEVSKWDRKNIAYVHVSFSFSLFYFI